MKHLVFIWSLDMWDLPLFAEENAPEVGYVSESKGFYWSVNVDFNRIDDDVRLEQCGGGACLVFTTGQKSFISLFISHHLTSHSTKTGLNGR